MRYKANIFDSISFWILVVTTFLLPVFFLPATMIGFAQVKISLLSIGVILSLIFFVIDRMRHGFWSVPLRPIYAFLLILPIVYAISSFLSVDVHKSLIGGLFEQDTFHVLGVLVIYVFLVMSLVRTQKRIGIIIISLIASILVTFVVQALRIVGGDMFSLGVLTSPSSTLVGRWNDLTILSVVFLGAIVIALQTIELKRWLVSILFVLMLVPFVCISLSTLSFDLYFSVVSLSVCMGILALLIFTYVVSIGRSKSFTIDGGQPATEKKSLVIVSSLVVLVLSIVLVFFGNPINQFLASSTKVLYSEGRPTWQSTYIVADKVLPQRPLFGSGPNSFMYEWNMNKPIGVNNFAFWNTDFDFGIGIIPSALVTVGILGFVLWVIFYVMLLLNALRMLFNPKYHDTIPMFFRVFVSFGTIFTTLMMFLYTPGIVVVGTHFLFIGLLFSLDAHNTKEKKIVFNNTPKSHFLSTFIILVLLISIAYWGYVVIKKDLANFYANTAVVKSTNEDQVIGYINTALRLDPSQSIYSQIAADAYASKVGRIASLPSEEAQSKKDEIKNDLVAAINYSAFAENVDKTDYKAILATGRILEFFGSLGVPGADEQAAVKYISAGALSPSNPLPYILASNVTLSAKNKDLSKEYLIQGLTLKSDYGDVPSLAQGIKDLIDRLNKANGVSASISPISTNASTTATSTSPKSTKSIVKPSVKTK